MKNIACLFTRIEHFLDTESRNNRSCTLWSLYETLGDHETHLWLDKTYYKHDPLLKELMQFVGQKDDFDNYSWHYMVEETVNFVKDLANTEWEWVFYDFPFFPIGEIDALISLKYNGYIKLERYITHWFLMAID